MTSLGIKAKVALATSLTSILMLALVTAVQMHRLQEDFSKVLFAQQTALINRTAEELDDKLLMLRDIIAQSARQQPPELATAPAKLREYYRDRAVLALFDDVLILSPQGRIIADLPEQPGRIGINASDRAYFKTVMQTRMPVISEPVIGRAQGQPIVQMVAPVLNARGEVVCVLIGVLRLYKDNLLGHLRNAKVGRTGYYFALTREAMPRYVLHPDAARLLKPRQPFANPATTRALEQGFEGTIDGINGSGQRTLNSYKALRAVNWVLAASLPAEEAFEPFNGAVQRLLWWSGLAALLAALLIGWLTMHLLAPLVRLRDAIVALRAAPAGYTPLPVATADEVGQLTSAFNALMQERLAADARLQNLVEYAPNAILVVDAEGRIESINREAERCFGYARTELLGRALTMLVPARLHQLYVDMQQRFFNEGSGAVPMRMGREQVLYGLRRDASEFPLELNLSAVRTDQGIKMLAMIADITERHRLQQDVEARAAELERERDRAEAANRAKSDFVANMSHEIRTPMNAVLGMVYLLGNTPLTPQQRKYLNMVRESGQSLLGILNDVLDFSKIEARHMELSPVDFALDEVVNALATLMTLNSGEKALELAIRVDPAIPRQLHGDALRLQQILVNLVGNAIKFTEQGEVAVNIELVAADARQILLRFEVRDSGMGMTQAQLTQLFNAFTQGDQSITRRFGGTGLGLAISKRLIELMGGEIAVASVPGQGSRFWFSLAFGVASSAAEERRQPVPGPLSVLVAVQHDSSRAILLELLRGYGWQADEAQTDQAARQCYQQRLAAGQPYDLLLLDWQLQDADGRSTAQALRSAAGVAAVPLVLLAHPRARAQAESDENAVVLVKPVTPTNLYDALQHALAGYGEHGQSSSHEASIAGSLAGVHFLLVEDNLLNQMVARGILEHAGATLDVVGDGRQAVERMRATPAAYDMILMDMQMPVMDGYTATRILRQQLGLRLPIIAMTAGVLGSERHRSEEAGISDFIPKPIEVDEMLAVLQRHLPLRSTVPLAQAVSAAAASVTPAAAEAGVFNMDSLMRVMGKDAAGRAMMERMVRGAIDSGMGPVEVAGLALQEGRLRDAAHAFHGLRGAVGVLGAKRLVQATLDAEQAINSDAVSADGADLAPYFLAVRQELALTLAQARAWLEAQTVDKSN
ncbi:response regulator [Duganella fentianensis]|uniref:response regulator n=1 Tax=Duganella fentianensis TaxID=2692177 RepID=UPI0032B13CBF